MVSKITCLSWLLTQAAAEIVPTNTDLTCVFYNTTKLAEMKTKAGLAPFLCMHSKAMDLTLFARQWMPQGNPAPANKQAIQEMALLALVGSSWVMIWAPPRATRMTRMGAGR